MANYTGPKVKLSRRVGVPIADLPKHTSKRQLNPPGMHGFRARRLRDFGIRLNEKQKLRYHFNVLEKQFRGYVAEAARMEGNTGNNILRLLEQRLDNAVRRLGWGRSIWQARQMVAHGHILVNGRKVDRPSYQVKVGDKLSMKKDNGKELAKNNMFSLEGHEVPGWLAYDAKALEASIVASPTAEQVPFDVNMNLIVEYYR